MKIISKAWSSGSLNLKMRSRAALIFAFIVLLIPSAQFAWRNSDMPDFGRLHDDGGGNQDVRQRPIMPSLGGISRAPGSTGAAVLDRSRVAVYQ
jgi:hypothetical protein